MTLTASKQISPPYSQTLADAQLPSLPQASWEQLTGFFSGTSADSASPFRTPDDGWIPALPPLVLLAHADEMRRGGLAWELGSGGCNVVEVEDGLELLDYLDDKGPWLPLPRPDVIVTELNMPGAGGLEAAKALRTAGDLTPIIFINVTRDPAAAEAAQALPHTRLVEGDVEGGVLRAAVEDALRPTAS